MRSLGTALEDVLTRLGIRGRLREYDAVGHWSSVVGPQVARVTEARSIRQGVLVVRVNNGPWRAELQLLKPDIIRKLNDDLGEPIVKDIRFV